MKVLFLDIDGVLNCHDDFDLKDDMFERRCKVLNASMVKRYKRMIKEIKPYVVLCSTWRVHGFLKDFLKENGIDFEDVTPDYSYSTRPCLRGSEVDDWLDKHPEVKKYAIVDDVNDYYNHQQEFFVETSFYNYKKNKTTAGLQPKHVKKIKQLLM